MVKSRWVSHDNLYRVNSVLGSWNKCVPDVRFVFIVDIRNINRKETPEDKI